jgi:hypothetical protein
MHAHSEQYHTDGLLLLYTTSSCFNRNITSKWSTFCFYFYIRGPFEKFMDSPYYSVSELCGGAVTVSSSKYLSWQAMHFLTLHPLFENVLQAVCRRRIVERTVFLPRSSLFMVGKVQKSHGKRSGLYDGCSNGVPPISVNASIVTLATCGLVLSCRLLRHPKKGSFKTTVTQTL